MKIFLIKPDENFDVSFRLALCRTRKEMLSAINRDKKKIPDAEIYPLNTVGMFRPFPGISNKDMPGVGYSNIFGTMYLNLTDLEDWVIVHECAHAAFAWEFYIRHYTGTFDDDCFDEQEEFCYFIGKAVDKVKRTIKKYKGGLK
jgi:hypothetical protein